VIPFLGAGANLCDRPEGVSWQAGYLPSGAELAAYLAETYAYPEQDVSNLLRIAQYVDLSAGDAALFDELHAIFAAGYEPNKLHRLIADLPRLLRAQGHEVCGQLLITVRRKSSMSSTTPGAPRTRAGSCT
jgi:hypothetical protein